MKPKALWISGAGQAELRAAILGEGTHVETLFSGISRGTERLVFEGRVPVSEADRMRAPAQEGDFGFPVKYGYCAVGRVKNGALAGRIVFALHPHQTEFCLSPKMIVPLPEGVPAERAVLAANMETALNILWDSGATAGGRILVVGAGVVGALVGYLAAALPGSEVTLVDTLPNRGDLAKELGCAFSLPHAAPGDCDTVIHTSASEDGLALAIDSAGQDATVIEGSWYGSSSVEVPLGGAFHSRRIRLVSSQVGKIPPAMAPRWTHRRRLAKALDLLRDPRLDILISGETDFEDLPECYAQILADPDTLCHRIRYHSN